MGRTGERGRRTRPAWLGLAILPLLSGCAFGPRALEATHGRYQESVKRVQDEELLRNLVRLRYNESYNNLDVTSITAQYELAGGAEARPFFAAPNPGSTSNGNAIFRKFTSVLPDVNVSGANRPTLSLVPDDDSDTIRRLLTPVTPEAVLFFTESGWPISAIFRLWLDSANSVPNAQASRGAGPARDGVPDYLRFRRAAALLQSLRQRGAATFTVEIRDNAVGLPVPADRLTTDAQVEAAKNGMEYAAGPEPGTCVLSRHERKMVLKLDPRALADPEYIELCDLLWLQPGLTQYDVTRGRLPPYPATFPPERLTSIDILPRSPVQALFYLSNGVAVPPEHLAAGLVRSTPGPDGLAFDWRDVTAGLFRVCWAKQHHRPEHAYVAVPYRDHWFYIDDRDHDSKTTFNLMLQLTRLDLTGSGPRPGGSDRPVLTLPIGR